jgi:hypothetical protein
MVYSYCTATQVEDEIRATTRFASTTIPSLSTVTSWITQESAQINRDTGTVYASVAATSDLDYNGELVMTLPCAPVISVGSVLYATSSLGNSDYSTSWETKTADTDYTVYLDTGELAILSNWSPVEGRKRIRVAYSYGYSTVPDVIQKLATKMVAERVLNSLISQNVNETNDGGSISVGSISIVEPSSYGVNSYKQLKTDIEDLKKSIYGTFGVYRYGSYTSNDL